MKINKRSWTNEQLIEAVKTSNTYKEVAKKLGLKKYGANNYTIKKYINGLNLDVSHFLTKQDQLAIARANVKVWSHEELFCVNDIDRKAIKKRILKDSLIPYVCSLCSITEWQGQALSLQLDHINGINNDNHLTNLRFLCPNCHSQTDTYCGRQLRGNSYGKATGSTAPPAEYCCKDCTTPISRKGSIRCHKCDGKHRKEQGLRTKIKWPNHADLQKLVDESSYLAVSKKLGVSDKAVKKRLRTHPE